MSGTLPWRLTPASEIIRSSSVDELMTEVVQNILNDVEDQVKVAVTAKREQTQPIQLPTHFDFPTMKRQDSQRYVYFYVLQALRQNKYIPKIYFTTDPSGRERVHLVVGWVKDEEKQMRKQMDEYIRGHSNALPEANEMLGKKKGK